MSLEFASLSTVNQTVVATDRLSHLPDEVLWSILSLLTIKEAARTGAVSKRWKNLWRHIPVLNFEDSVAMDMFLSEDCPVSAIEVESRFITHVNHVLKEHLGLASGELRIAFCLDDRHETSINQWLIYALEKQVKRIELNLEPVGTFWKEGEWVDYYWSLPYIRRYNLSLAQSHKLASLTSLCLRNVNVSSEAIEFVLQSCHLLVALCVTRSVTLTSIATSGFSLRLELLEVSFCPNFDTLHTNAPKLLSQQYNGKPIKLQISNASLLSRVHIGGQGQVKIAPLFDSLSEYFAKLKYLRLQMSFLGELNLRPSHVPALTSLKHLRLDVCGRYRDTIAGWTSLIDACPVLEKLTLQLFIWFEHAEAPKPKVKHQQKGRPLRCFKTLEIPGYDGTELDLELAYYVLQNAVCLKQVIVDCKPLKKVKKCKNAHRRLRMLKKKIRRGIVLTLKQTHP